MTVSLQLPLRSVFIRNGCPADVRIWPSRSKVPRVIILFVCGNPGLIDYYEEFLTLIHAQSSSDHTVIGVGHEGHSARNPSEAAKASLSGAVLSSQIQSKLAYVDFLREEYGPNAKVVLMGHSVGAYICQEIMRSRADCCTHFYGLFPTIANIGQSPNGQRLNILFKHPTILAVRSFLALIDLVLPYAVLHAAVRMLTGQRPPGSRVTADFLANAKAVEASLRMASDEMEMIRELDEEFLSTFGNRITLYFAAGSADGWVGSSAQVQSITAALDRSKNPGDTRERWHVCQVGMVHAFCLEHSSAMAKQCARWLAIDLA